MTHDKHWMEYPSKWARLALLSSMSATPKKGAAPPKIDCMTGDMKHLDCKAHASQGEAKMDDDPNLVMAVAGRAKPASKPTLAKVTKGMAKVTESTVKATMGMVMVPTVA